MSSDSEVIEMTIEPRERPVGAGTVRRLLPYRRRRMVGPFIFCDLMGPEDLAPGQGMSVDAHPHIGLSTLTYLLSGRAVHRDSTGAVATIEAGAVNWMTAGEGVTHTERRHPDDVDRTTMLFGAQLWVALPTDAEDGVARFEHADVADVPVEATTGVEIAVPAGTAFGLRSPIVGSSPLMLADVQLDDGALVLDAEHPERAVVAMTGDVKIDDVPMAVGAMAVIERGARPRVTGSGRALVLGGEPVGRRHIWWNFVHSDPDRIEHAKQEWSAQRFPVVPRDHDPWVPLPE